MTEPRVELALPLGDWHVTLHDGSTVRLKAVGYSRVDDREALVSGKPDYETTLAELSVDIVAPIRGG